MKKTKIGELLLSFTQQELKLFSLWLQSPLHCSSEKLPRLLKIICQQSELAKGKIEDKEKIATAFFGKQKPDESLFRNLLSDLLAQAENFLAWKSFNEQPGLRLYFLLKEYNSRKLPAHVAMRLKQKERISEDSQLSRLQKTLALLLIEEEEMLFSYLKTSSVRQKVFKEYQDRKILDLLLTFFTERYLHFFLIGLDTETVFGQKTLSGLPEAGLILQLAEEKFASDVYIQLHARLIRYLLANRDERIIADNFTDIFQSGEFLALHESDKKNIITTTINILLAVYNKGREDVLPLLCRIMDFALLHKSAVRNNILSSPFFINYVVFHLNLGMEEKASQFISAYGPLLDPAYKESTLNLAQANLLFCRHKFHEAQRCLSQVSADTPQRFLGVKNLLLKIYFEKKEWGEIPGIVDSIRHKLSNEKYFSDIIISSEKHFLSIFRKLCAFSSGEKKISRSEKASLVKEIDSTAYLLQKQWLSEKATRLE